MTKKPFVAAAIILVAIVIGVNIFIFTGTQTDTTNTPQPIVEVQDQPTVPTQPTTPTPKPTTKPTQPTPPQDTGISATTLAQHSTSDDCWVIYKGKVYDITSFLPDHPGGTNAIARYCGKEGFESAFQRQHGTSKANMFMKVTIYEGDYSA